MHRVRRVIHKFVSGSCVDWRLRQQLTANKRQSWPFFAESAPQVAVQIFLSCGVRPVRSSGTGDADTVPCPSNVAGLAIRQCCIEDLQVAAWTNSLKRT